MNKVITLIMIVLFILFVVTLNKGENISAKNAVAMNRQGKYYFQNNTKIGKGMKKHLPDIVLPDDGTILRDILK